MSHLGLSESLAGEGSRGQMHKLFRLRRPKPGKVQTPTLPQQSKPREPTSHTLLSLKRSSSWVAGMILRVMDPWDWA